MKEKLDQIRQAYDALAIRERALILCAVLGALYGLTNMMFLQPMDVETQRLRTQLKSGIEAITEVGERTRLLGKQIEGEIPKSFGREEQALERQIEVMNGQIEERMSSMIPPDEVARMLEELLGRESELTLVELVSVKAAAAGTGAADGTAAASGDASAAEDEATEFYRHGFIIELEGSYLAALHYLESIEGLPWELSWDRITYEVTEYPRARVSIRLHTLSRQENWIGV